MADFFTVLGFVNSDGSVGFGQTKKPLTYIENLRSGESKNRWVEQDAELRWACPVRTRERAVELRDHLNSISPTRATKTISAASVPSTVVKELLQLSGTSGALRARKLIKKHGKDPYSASIVGNRVRPPHTSPFLPLPKPCKPSATYTVRDVDLGIRLAIFDIDATLLDTSALRAQRNFESWDRVSRRTKRIVPLPCWNGLAPHQIPGILDELGIYIALVSRANQSYVEKVAGRFDIPSDWICAPSQGPMSEIFEEAMEQFEASPSETVVFGDDRRYFEGAAHHEALSLGNPWICSNNPSTAPDVAWLDGSALLEEGDWHQRLGYIGEVPTDKVEWHRGSLLRLSDSDAYALGRYFPTRFGRRHYDLLTQRILAGKSKQSGDPHLLSAFGTSVARLSDEVDIDVVISVPPHSGQSDRFEPYRRIVVDIVNADDDIAIRQDPDTQPSSTLSGAERRRRREGRFEIGDDLDGLTVLLVDDVVTTGSTLGALKDAAELAGAENVIQIAFGLTQN